MVIPLIGIGKCMGNLFIQPILLGIYYQVICCSWYASWPVCM